MMRQTFLLASVLSAVLLAGCSMPWREAQINVENSKNLRVGMTKAEVLKIMGDPLQDETFCRPDLWYYYIETVWADGLVAEEECMPLVFENGKLVGWGRVFLTKYRLRSRDNAKKLLPPAARPADPAQVKAQTAPVKAAPVKPAPAKAAPVKPAPAKAAPAKDAPEKPADPAKDGK